MFGLYDSILCLSDDVLISGSKVRASLLELEALLDVWARVAYLDTVLHLLDSDKG